MLDVCSPARLRLLVVSTVLALAVLCLMARTASAGVTRTVCAAGMPTCDFSTIQAAIDASLDEDVIQVTPGDYAESVVVDRRVTVRGPGYGFNARSDAPSALNAFRITGDGSGPSLTIGGRGRVVGAVISGATGDGVSGVEFVEAVGAPLGEASGTLENSLVTDNTSGVRGAAASRGHITLSRITANSAAGVGSGVGVWDDGARTLSITNSDIDAQPVAGIAMVASAGSASFSMYNGVIRDAPIAIDAIDIDSVSVSGTSIHVPAGGIGIRDGDGVDRLDVAAAVIDGGGRAGSVGVVLDGTGHQAESIRTTKFEGLTTAVRIAGPAPTSPTQVSGNLIVTTSTVPPVELATMRSASAFDNFVACPAADCVTFTGVGAALGQSNDLTPAMWFTDHYGEAVRLTSVKVDGYRPTVFVWVGLVDGSGSPFSIGGLQSNPLRGLTATLTGAAGLVGRAPFSVGRSDWFELTQPPGTRFSLSGTILGRPFVSPVLHVRGVMRPKSKATIIGAAHVGQRVTCASPQWSTKPTSVAYQWSESWVTKGDGTELVGPVTHVVTREDFKRGRISCTIRAKFADYEDAISTVTVRVTRFPLTITVTPLNAGWRAMRCGTSPTRTCIAARRIGVRFGITTPSRARTKASIQFQRKMRGRWVAWVRGTLPLPNRRGFVIPGKLVPPGSYRMRFTVGVHDVYTRGTSAWSHWVVQ